MDHGPALLHAGVDVARDDVAWARPVVFHHQELAARLRRRQEEADALAGRAVLDDVVLAPDHAVTTFETSAPKASIAVFKSSSEVSSTFAWLIPPRDGQNIIAAGMTRATLAASWSAPLVIR